MDPSAQAVPGYYAWELPGKPVVIHISLDVIDRISIDVMRGFGAVPKRGAEVGGVLLGTIETMEDGGQTLVRIEDYEPLLRTALARDLPMVCANPDLVVMHGSRRALCAGALAKWYEEGGGRVRWHGKPFRSVYDTCLGLLAIKDRWRILAVGDSLRTDIAGAAGAGLDSLLIAGGIHAEEFRMVGDRPPDLTRVEAAIRDGSYSPVGVAWRFCW